MSCSEEPENVLGITPGKIKKEIKKIHSSLHLEDLRYFRPGCWFMNMKKIFSGVRLLCAL
jgi:hypothetical protein